eukprot:gene9449-12733_t
MIYFERYLVVFCVVIGFCSASASTCAVSDSAKVDCGYAGITQDGCQSKGCCWSPAGQNSVTPWCFNAGESTGGYSLSNVEESTSGFSGKLSLISGTSTYGADLSSLMLYVSYESEDIIRIKITDPSSSRWEVPYNVINRNKIGTYPKDQNTNLKLTYNSSPFSFEVTRVSDGKSIFKADSSIIFKDQYIQISTSTDSTATTFGLGESARTNHALKTGKTYTMWAADVPSLVKDTNLYGSFPFYLQMVNGAAHGAMMMNSNGMDVDLQQNSITFKMIGGIIDLYVFAGSTPSQVVSQYTQIVGRPAMMPYWSLGFHNCKYGYTSLNQVQQVVANYSAAGIPLDTQWMDIDYMQNYRDFTFDSVNFPQEQVSAFVYQLHSNGQHFVPIVDPGIMVKSNYDAYEQGLKEDLFVKDIKGGYYLGQVWPGPTYFPDFLHPSAQDYWTSQMKTFHEAVNVDGIWIDMNEASNFCNDDGAGQVCANTAPSGCPAPGASQTDCCLSCTMVDSSNKYDFPPYAINNNKGKLSTKTIAVSATQYGGVSMYNSHNLYGLTEQIATNQALATIRSKRPFLLTRSSFLSSGVHTAKWTGDNGATWDDLKASIVGIMDFNMFGVPMVGADICGFIYDTTEELCARWIEVGSFYPFSRNHNTLGAAPQELYLWDNVAAASRNALSIRYQLLPYMYTLFYNANTAGETVIRALWMNFPSDSNALSVDRQFMVGSGILVSPVLDQGVTSVNAYFPQGLWYSFSDKTLAVDASSGGVTKSLYTPLTSTNVHVKGGVILPLQQSAMTTTKGRATPFTLFAALCPKGKAFGSLFWDDGEQIEIKSYLSLSFTSETNGSTGFFKSSINHYNYAAASSVGLATIIVSGKGLTKPTSALLNGKSLSSSQIVLDASSTSLSFTSLGLHITDSIELSWS